jgi:alcohol dehydrogenase
VLIGVDAVGICGSDMHAYHGLDPRRVPPLILGHELVGRILEGPGAGGRVTVNPLITCGACEYCRQGRDNLCSNRTMIGMTRAGGFAQRMTTAARSVIDIPQQMSVRAAALTEPAATALHAIDRATRALARPLPEARVLVLGGGAIGLLCARLLARYGVRHIAVAETNALRRASIATATSARAYDPAADATPADGSVDLVIDAVGAASTRTVALAAVKPGGVVVHVGLQDRASEIDMLQADAGGDHADRHARTRRPICAQRRSRCTKARSAISAGSRSGRLPTAPRRFATCTKAAAPPRRSSCARDTRRGEPVAGDRVSDIAFDAVSAVPSQRPRVSRARQRQLPRA